MGDKRLGFKAIFATFRMLIFFFTITSFSAIFRRKFLFFMMKLEILHAFTCTNSCGLVV